MLLKSLTILAAVEAASAFYASNLNYRSPSHNHPGLGIAIHKVNKRNDGAPPIDASKLNFTHGVASGDPYATSVILWTRIAPSSDDVNDNTTVTGYAPLFNPVPIFSGNETGKPSKAPVCVNIKVSKDSKFSSAAFSGTAYTSSDVDYTVKVNVPTTERDLKADSE